MSSSTNEQISSKFMFFLYFEHDNSFLYVGLYLVFNFTPLFFCNAFFLLAVLPDHRLVLLERFNFFIHGTTCNYSSLSFILMAFSKLWHSSFWIRLTYSIEKYLLNDFQNLMNSHTWDSYLIWTFFTTWYLSILIKKLIVLFRFQHLIKLFCFIKFYHFYLLCNLKKIHWINKIWSSNHFKIVSYTSW